MEVEADKPDWQLYENNMTGIKNWEKGSTIILVSNIFLATKLLQILTIYPYLAKSDKFT